MAIGTPEKKDRNDRIFTLKKKMTFKKLARMMNISEARVKEIYYKELRKRGIKPRRYNKAAKVRTAKA